MAERTTIARPYAQAVFELARDAKGYKKWSEALAIAAQVAADPQVEEIIDSPRVTREQVVNLFLEVCGKALDQQSKNFIRLLAENHRLALLPEIAALYEIARSEAEGTVTAEVTSAAPLTDAQQQAIAAALSKRLERKVSLECKIDDSLLGGAVIRAGDLVIDGSVHGKLQRLGSRLLA